MSLQSGEGQACNRPECRALLNSPSLQSTAREPCNPDHVLQTSGLGAVPLTSSFGIPRRTGPSRSARRLNALLQNRPCLHDPTAPHEPSRSARAAEDGLSHRAHFRWSGNSKDTLPIDEPCHSARRLNTPQQRSERPTLRRTYLPQWSPQPAVVKTRLNKKKKRHPPDDPEPASLTALPGPRQSQPTSQMESRHLRSQPEATPPPPPLHISTAVSA